MPAAAIEASPTEQTVATLRAGEEVDGLFACVSSRRQISRAGSPYLTLELRDRTGAILARAFRDADVLAGRFQEGELVRVRGRVERFRERLQIELVSISSAAAEEVEERRFLPTSFRDLDELDGFFEHLAGELSELPLGALVEALIGDGELRSELRRAPCSVPAARIEGAAARGRPAHHAYLGGLLEHTVAVATLALEACQLHPRLDRDLLLCAALVHDLGKTREFDYGADICLSQEGRLLGHVELGLRVIAEHAPASLNGERRLALEHCVMLHHGPDGARGQRFASPESLALYRLNALDADVKGALESGGLGRMR